MIPIRILDAISTGINTQSQIETFNYAAIGSWWKSKGDQHEIDIVAVSLDKTKAFVAEVKRRRKNFKPQLFERKIELLHETMAFLKNIFRVNLQKFRVWNSTGTDQ
jgi:hypothetical protein